MSPRLPRIGRGQDGYRTHRQVTGPFHKAYWFLVLDASGETVCLCDSQESADMICLALNETRRTHVVLAGVGGLLEAEKPAAPALAAVPTIACDPPREGYAGPVGALRPVPDPSPTAPYLADEDEPSGAA